MNEQALAMALLHFLWQGAFLAAIAAIAFAVLRSPQARYGTGCALLAGMAVAPALTMLMPAASPALQTAATVPAAGVFMPALQVSEPAWLDYVVYAWVCGVLVFSLRAAGGLGLAAWKLSHNRRLLEVRDGVRLFASTAVAVPSVIGVLRPAVLLPLSALANLSPAELEAVIAHELAHVRRFDFLINCLQSVVEAALFYHPAVWWLSRRVREERELCCDAAAVVACGDPVLYSRALLTLEEARSAFVLGASGGNLRARVEQLLGRNQRTGVAAVIVPALVILLLIASASTVAFAEAPPPPPVPPAPAVPAQAPAPSKNATRKRPPVSPQPPAAPRADEVASPPAPPPPPPADVLGGIVGRKVNARIAERAEANIERQRRHRYSTERFGGDDTPRGRIYIQNGPPSEIETYQGTKETWRYTESGLEYEFQGPENRLVRIRVNGQDYTHSGR